MSWEHTDNMSYICNISKRITVQSKCAIITGIASFLCKGINIITLPLFTNVLSSSEMGVVATYSAWFLILSVVANLALDSGAFNIAMHEFERERIKYISSSITLSFCSSIIISILLLVNKRHVCTIMGIDDVLLYLMVISFFLFPSTNFWIMYQRYEYRYIKVAVVIMVTSGLSVLASAIITVFASNYTDFNLIHVRLISANSILIFVGLFFTVFFLYKGKVGYSEKYWGFIFRVNTPLIIHAIGRHLLDASDKTMISYMVGAKEVGVYGVMYSISSIGLLAWNAINAAFIPYMFNELSENSTNLEKRLEDLLFGYGFICVCFTLLAPEIVKMLTTVEYFAAIDLMPPIIGGVYMIALYNVFSNILLYYKKTMSIMFATVIAAITNVLLNAIFIPLLGYIAAAYTTLFSYMILAILQFVVLKKNCCLYMSTKKLWKIATTLIISCLVSGYLYSYLYMRVFALSALILLAIVYGYFTVVKSDNLK